MTCKKIPCYMPTQLAGGLLLKMIKYFEVMLLENYENSEN